jgi:hypothetical protein
MRGAWTFLTGSREDLWHLARVGFGVTKTLRPPAPPAPLVSTSRLALVDRIGRVRGFYAPDALQQLALDIDLLLDEPVPENVAVPPTIINPDWVDDRRQAQFESASEIGAFYKFLFEDRILESGITFQHRIVDDAGFTWKPVHYDHGNGVAAADVDGDGLLDLYFTNQIGPNALYRNLGDGTFQDITDGAGVGLADRVSVGASFGDVDNDGDPDLFVTSVRVGNVLFQNDGGGRFQDITAAAGLAHKGHSSGTVFFDYDRDGLLDMLVTNVGQYTSPEARLAVQDGTTGVDTTAYYFFDGFGDAFDGHLHPERFERSLLYHNTGDARFEEVGEALGLVDVGFSGDATTIDGNSDGWPDLYLLNMQGDDQYFENVNGTAFRKRSRELFPKTPWGAMGIRSFDFENDGDMDIYITDMHSDMSEHIAPDPEKQKSNMQWDDDYLLTGHAALFGNAFFRKDGPSRYAEVSDLIGAENYWPWGLSTGDVNADGFEDAFLTSSMNFPFRYSVNSLLLNDGGKRFADAEYLVGVEPRRDGLTAKPWFDLDCINRHRDHRICKEQAEAGHQPAHLQVWGALGSRSSVIFDLEGDGDLDIVTSEFNSEPMVLVSTLSEHRPVKFLQVTLKGTTSNRSGVGARVAVHSGSATYTKIQDGKSGYLSQSDMPLYFGLNMAESADRIEVVWPTGSRQVIEGPFASGQTVVVEESVP